MVLTIEALNAALEEVYEVGALPPAEQAKFYLICRYEDKVSNRLLEERKSLRLKGKALWGEQLRELITQPNPLLSLVPKPINYTFAPLPLFDKLP